MFNINIRANNCHSALWPEPFVDDQAEVRTALRSMFESQEPHGELYKAEDRRRALELTRNLDPEVRIEAKLLR